MTFSLLLKLATNVHRDLHPPSPLPPGSMFSYPLTQLASVFQRVDSAIHWIHHNLVDHECHKKLGYPLRFMFNEKIAITGPGLEVPITYSVGNLLVFQNVPVRRAPISENFIHQHPETIHVRSSWKMVTHQRFRRQPSHWKIHVSGLGYILGGPQGAIVYICGVWWRKKIHRRLPLQVGIKKQMAPVVQRLDSAFQKINH